MTYLKLQLVCIILLPARIEFEKNYFIFIYQKKIKMIYFIYLLNKKKNLSWRYYIYYFSYIYIYIYIYSSLFLSKRSEEVLLIFFRIFGNFKMRNRMEINL